jgi:hypothetical protein
MRLGKYSTVMFVPGLVATTLLAGCIIVGTGSSSGSGGVGGGLDTSSGSGVGGEIETTTATTTTTSSGTMCIGVNGTGLVSDCDKLNIAPMNGASKICGPMQNEPPPGYDACKYAFSVFTSGPATDLVNCLAGIGVQNACSDALVQSCVDDMYKNTCHDKQFDDSCASLDTDCAGAKQGNIDRAQCVQDLTPLNQTSITTFFDCLEVERAKAGMTCKVAYVTCYDKLLQ